MVKKEDLINIGKETLKHILNKYGEVIYSSHNTIKKGDIYLLGLNPGGEGFIMIDEHLSNLLTKETNSYLDEEWENGITKWKKGEAPLQKRVCYLLEALGYNVRDICASNLIFVTSRNSDEINYGLAGYCWRFHEYLIELIQPKLILCFGISSVSSYSFLKVLFEGEELTYDSHHGDWKCKAFNTVINNKEIKVIGVPHLSYYNIIGKDEVIKWLKDNLV